jgi:hypothetical protein
LALDRRLALLDPGAVFATPEEVLDSTELMASEKSEILRRWAYDVVDSAVAVEEGMPEAAGNDLLQSIFLALGRLSSDLDSIGPTKQHGLPVERDRNEAGGRDADGND